MFDLYFILAVNKTKFNTQIFAYEKYNFHGLFYSNYIFMKIKASFLVIININSIIKSKY